jgi:hypothetical protein
MWLLVEKVEPNNLVTRIATDVLAAAGTLAKDTDVSLVYPAKLRKGDELVPP